MSELRWQRRGVGEVDEIKQARNCQGPRDEAAMATLLQARASRRRTGCVWSRERLGVCWSK